MREAARRVRVPLAARWCAGQPTTTPGEWLDLLLSLDPHAERTVRTLDECAVDCEVVIAREFWYRCEVGRKSFYNVLAHLLLDDRGAVVHRLAGC